MAGYGLYFVEGSALNKEAEREGASVSNGAREIGASEAGSGVLKAGAGVGRRRAQACGRGSHPSEKKPMNWTHSMGMMGDDRQRVERGTE